MVTTFNPKFIKSAQNRTFDKNAMVNAVKGELQKVYRKIKLVHNKEQAKERELRRRTFMDIHKM